MAPILFIELLASLSLATSTLRYLSLFILKKASSRLDLRYIRPFYTFRRDSNSPYKA